MSIDKDEVKKALTKKFNNSKVKNLLSSEDTNSITCEQSKVISSDLPKHKTLERITLLISSEQRDAIDKLSKKIMRHRSKDTELSKSRERITSNSLFRALVTNFLERVDSLQMETICDETTLTEWVGKLFLNRS